MIRTTRTHTHTTLFDTAMVDELVGGAHKALAEDYELRRPYIDEAGRLAAEARLDLLRRTWQVLLDPSP